MPVRSINALSAGKSRYLCFVGVVASLLLAGCQFMPSDRAAAPADEMISATTQGTPDGEAVTPRAPNPYLLDPPYVPAEARQRFVAAQAAMQEQQWAVAETDLLWLTQHYPQFSGPFLNLALVYQQLGKPSAVEAAFQQAIATNANNVQAYNEWGIYLRGEGRFEEAESAYRQALVVWPDSPATHLNLGILYDLYMGRLEEALTHYRRYQALQEEADRRVQGWIVDTERRLQQGAVGG